MIESAQTSFFWASPAGELHVAKAGSANHIQHVLEDPSLFGFSQSLVLAVYAKYEEPVGSEGRARDEILALVLRDGWVRIRSWQEGARKRWYFEVSNIEHQRTNLKRAIEAVLYHMDKRDRIIIADKRQVLDPMPLQQAFRVAECKTPNGPESTHSR